VKARVAYHDSCYLGRYNDIYDPPRRSSSASRRRAGRSRVLDKNKGLCCGAGGAQMFMEEQNKDRVNVKRTLQLLDTGAKTIASACPFCMTMVTDGIKAQGKEDEVKTWTSSKCWPSPAARRTPSEGPWRPRPRGSRRRARGVTPSGTVLA
jgi:Fe-S oxidoreductase